MTQTELTNYFEKSIQSIIATAIKSALKNPKETEFLLKYGRSCKKASQIREEYKSQSIHIPAFLICSITSNCNLYCSGCYARANQMCTDQQTKSLLSVEKWNELFHEASKLGIPFALLAGGEPLLRKDVIETAAKHKDILFPIFTNGTMINEAYLALFHQNRNLVPILSLEGKEEKTDVRRGKGTYQKLITVMDELKKKHIFYGASITVTIENIEEVSSDTFLNELYERGCKAIFFVEYVPFNQNTKHLEPTDKERAFLETRLSIVREAYDDIIFLSFPGDEKYMGGCLAAGRGFFHINPTGDAEPCPFSPYSDINLKTHSLLDALQSPFFQKVQELNLLGGDHNGGCALFAQQAEVEELLKK